MTVFFRRMLTGGLLVAVLAAAPAWAMPGQKGGMSAADRFDRMDTDKDGKVTPEEFRASFPNMNEKAFAIIDVNGDKAIDRAEWLEFSAGHARGAVPQGMKEKGAPMNNMPGEPLIPPPDSSDLPLVRAPN